MPYRIRFTIKKPSRAKRGAKYAYGQVRFGQLFVGQGPNIVRPHRPDEATVFATYEEAAAALAHWMAYDNRANWDRMWIKNPMIERVHE
ncbi:hypothetical protein [Sphingopyxis flava]|uniref:Uncharacterized protein n=1 Tax=Sphingopyxis flava TaxID=1507287 RepID=A0A1T5CTY7_9SPHN|nr:hypothetical protein [Sphingopyxis flava]SKB62874.1 hypothetical protein SAMN06295937_1011112 [Sphingopyxis flava]